MTPAPHACEVYTSGEACGRCVACNADVQLAASVKYSSALTCVIAEIRPGLFALYQHANVLFIGEWDEVLHHYRARPKWEPKPRPPRKFAATRSRGKLSAEEKRANTAALLARLAGGNNAE